jgi:hypothetical protein
MSCVRFYFLGRAGCRRQGITSSLLMSLHAWSFALASRRLCAGWAGILCKLWAGTESVTNLAKVAVYYARQPLVGEVWSRSRCAGRRRAVRSDLVVDIFVAGSAAGCICVSRCHGGEKA